MNSEDPKEESGEKQNALTRPRVIKNTRESFETDKDPSTDASLQKLENRSLDIPEGDPDFINDSARLYVSTDGNDDNSGSLNAPFRTIQHAIDNAQAGDVISIRKGTYRERLKIEELNGREDAPITFENYQNEEVILSGASPINSTWVKHENNIWKTNLNFDVSQLFLDCLLYTSPSPRDS